MSTDNGEEPQQIPDEEGNVDKTLKNEIIKARRRVSETEMALYRDAAIEPDIRLREHEKVHIYGTTVKQFLRWIEPLLRNEKMPGSADYYEDEEIGAIQLIPPDTDGYRFSLVTDTSLGEQQLRQRIGVPTGVELPEPTTVAFEGLRDIIEEDSIITEQWEVCVSRDGAPPNWEYVYPAVQRAVPKRIYTDAMRMAVMFLQEAGIGLDIEMPAYTGGEEPGL